MLRSLLVRRMWGSYSCLVDGREAISSKLVPRAREYYCGFPLTPTLEDGAAVVLDLSLRSRVFQLTEILRDIRVMKNN